MLKQQETAKSTGEGYKQGLRVSFDGRLKSEFHGSKITCDAGLPACRELDEALELTAMARLRQANAWRSFGRLSGGIAGFWKNLATHRNQLAG